MADATMPHVSRDNIDDVFSEDSSDGQDSDHGDGGDNDGIGDEDVGDEGVGDDGVGDEREFIQCDKNGFTNNKVSRSVKDILEQCYDGDWVTFKKVPQSARMRMFDRFRVIHELIFYRVNSEKNCRFNSVKKPKKQQVFISKKSKKSTYSSSKKV
ncbi:hypothetical protein Hanom_Chr04g00295151 [Helianthus anomalus]